MNRTAPDRISPDRGLALMADPDLPRLGALAQEARFARHPEPRVTYVVDTNPNYTNVCTVGCRFCAFYRTKESVEAFTLTVEEVAAKATAAAEAGATTMLLQGGINPDLPLDYFIDLVRAVKQAAPTVTPHFFSPPELHALAQRSGLELRDVLDRLYEAGQRTLPGGGAEILSARVRDRVSPEKCTADQWLEVMRQAHLAGMRSTATMMFGHLESDHDIIEHLERIRELQDETGGFTAFIPWSVKSGNTELRSVIPRAAASLRYLRLLAVARLYLDNVPHVQASWFSEGKPIGQLALHFGADDFGGVLLEENVHRSADYVNTSNEEEVRAMITEAGFEPVRRDTLYRNLAG
jgi:cyclic dehypoxanthinyl futalosine synthase